MTQAEEKVVKYAQSVDWDYDQIAWYINTEMSLEEYNSLAGENSGYKADQIIEKFKLAEVKTRLRKLVLEPEREKNPIELMFHATEDVPVKADGDSENPKWWDNLVLVERDYENGLDLILAYNTRFTGSVRCRSLMLGKWNDGVLP